jgi:methylated-DNA-[protein]-cysteine S-methyltransferase
MTATTATTPIRYTSVETPVGRLWVGYESGRVCAAMLTEDEQRFVAEYRAAFGRPMEPDPSPPADLLAAITQRLADGGDVPFDLDRFTPFQRAVLEAVAAIPAGEVRTYGEVALAVGRPRAARAVGEVMRTNQIPVLIPCHRVVRASGDIGRYSPDPAIKRRLLILEGALPDET